MGYGLGPASNAAFDGGGEKRSISILGDGGFWHNGLSSSIGNAVYNKSDGVIVIVDNFYSAATGGQDILSSRADNASKATGHPIAEAVKGVGVKWVRQIDRTYDVPKMREILKEALTTDHEGPKVIVASSECMLNKQRRETPLMNKAIGRPPRRETAFRRRRGHLHRRSRLYAALRLPVAVAERSRTIRCATTRSPASTRAAWDAAIAARWPMPPCFAHPSTAPMWSTIRVGPSAPRRFRKRGDRMAAKPPLARPHRICPGLSRHGNETQIRPFRAKPPDAALDQIIKLASWPWAGRAAVC
jgi:hypothetical protein